MKKFNDKKQFQQALELFYQCEQINNAMISDLAVSQALKSCTNMKDLQAGLNLHGRYSSLLEKNNYSLASLIHFYMQLEDVHRAQEIFDKLKTKTVGIYGAMMKGYIRNDMTQKAIDIFFKMPNPDEKNVSLLFNACARVENEETLGLVKKVLSNLPDCHQNNAHILTTAFDVFIKCNDLSNAERIFPKISQNTAEKFFNRIQKHFPELKNRLIAASVLLANVYASTGEIEKSSSINNNLTQLSLKKTSGLSYTEVNGQIYTFRAHDSSHPRSNEIYVEAEKISKELIEHGHQYDSSWITRPLYENETVESVLCGHSERLAIAWNFVANPNVSRIQITENLRICGDCHQSTKLIAAIRQCEIIVRDANRIHHFHTNGQCSCNDYS